ncbi:MAG: ImmA/IrrE family metallo-endopeptidase [Halorhodospira sp.]
MDIQGQLRRFGESGGLQLGWQPDKNPVRPDAPLGRGRLYLALGGVTLWGEEGQDGASQGIEADWAPLLEHLAGTWPWLMLEEVYPLGLTPPCPSQLWQRVDRRFGGAEALADSEHDALIHFEHRHDLAAGLDGVILPRLLMLREGEQYWLECPEQELLLCRPREEIVETLTQLGDALARHVAEQSEAGERLARFWEEREERTQQRFFELRSGLSSEERRELIGDEEEPIFWETADGDSEVMAAARMAVDVAGTDVLAEVLAKIRALPHRDTSVLDGIGARIQTALDSFPPEERPFRLGHEAASQLRGYLGLGPDEPIPDLEEWLRGHGVLLEEAAFEPEGRLEAVACWGPHHGPAILLNTVEGGRASHPGARRSTLAHELCHLLLDRYSSLPLAEVLGGATPLWLEQRANAFSAELLLPREVALAGVQRAPDLNTAFQRLTEHYAVSRQLAANQVRNAPGYEAVVTNRGDQRRIRQWADTHA